MAIRLPGLECDAFRKRSRADPGGIERLHDPERRFGLGEGDAEIARDFGKGDGKIAGLVEQADQVARDPGDVAVVGGRSDLGFEMLDKRKRAAAAFIDAGKLRPAAEPQFVGPVSGVTVAVKRGSVYV